MSLSDNYCNFCWSNDWQPNGGDNTPTFLKGGHSGPIHVKCFMYIEKNPESPSVKVYHLFSYLNTIDWVKTTEYTEEDINKELMEEKDITQKMIDKYSKPKCSICNEYILSDLDGWDGGHNASPINDGRCCGKCNKIKVIPARLDEWEQYQKENKK